MSAIVHININGIKREIDLIDLHIMDWVARKPTKKNLDNILKMIRRARAGRLDPWVRKILDAIIAEHKHRAKNPDPIRAFARTMLDRGKKLNEQAKKAKEEWDRRPISSGSPLTFRSMETGGCCCHSGGGHIVGPSGLW